MGKYKLEENVRPTHYDLRLKPNYDDFTFDGVVTVDLDVKTPTSQVELNAVNLIIDTVEVDGVNKACSVTYHEKAERAVLSFKETFNKNFSLRIFYKGELNDKMVGFYRSKSGNKTILSTQFEATYARQALPCWDEPEVKATFDVTIVAPEGLTVLSNMPVKSTKNVDGLVETVFDRSPLMSSYLLAWVIGELEYNEIKLDNIVLRAYTTIGNKDKSHFALKCTYDSLKFFGDYFGTPYPLPKLDIVAIPDFASGAMENWGLITFRATTMLYSDGVSSLRAKLHVCYVVCHEVAHQWFGNLVTMKWWNDLWLNEGFATYMGFLATSKILPELSVWLEFLVDNWESGLTEDWNENSHAIEVVVEDARKIDQIFNNIVYSKGASLIKMLNDYTTSEVFIKGIREYIKKFSYKNTETTDLWDSIENARSIMPKWTKQRGFPLVHVDGENTITLSQEPFADSEKTIWPCPIVVSMNGNSEKVERILLTEKRTFKVENYDYLIANKDTNGYFRVQYGDKLMEKILNAIANDQVNKAERYGVLSDVFALFLHGYVHAETLMNALSAYRKERNYFVLTSASAILDLLNGLYYGEPLGKKIMEFSLDFFNNEFVSEFTSFKTLNYENEEDTLTASLCILNAGRFGNKRIIETAIREVKDKGLHKQLRSVCFKLAVANGKRDVFDFIRRIYEETTIPDVKMEALWALGQTKDEELFREQLAYVVSDSVRVQDYGTAFIGMASNKEMRAKVWSYIEENWVELCRKFERKTIVFFSRVLKGVIERLDKLEYSERVSGFFSEKEHLIDGIEYNVHHGMRTLRNNALTGEREREAFTRFFK